MILLLSLRVPLIGRRRVSFEPLAFDIRQTTLLALLGASKWLIMHLLALNILGLLHGARWRWD